MSYSSLKYSLDFGRCESCDCRTCECVEAELSRKFILSDSLNPSWSEWIFPMSEIDTPEQALIRYTLDWVERYKADPELYANPAESVLTVKEIWE